MNWKASYKLGYKHIVKQLVGDSTLKEAEDGRED